MASIADQGDLGVPTLQEVLEAAEKKLAGLRKDADERRKWLANNVPDLNSKLTNSATQALFAKKLCSFIEMQQLEVAPISAEQLVQNLREQLEEIQEIVAIKKADIEETKLELQNTKEKVELLARVRKLRQTEGEIQQDERLTEKLAASNRNFREKRKWLGSVIEEMYSDNDEMTDLLRDLTGAYYSDGDPYISAVTDGETMSICLAALIESGAVSRHPYDPNRVRLQDLS